MVICFLLCLALRSGVLVSTMVVVLVAVARRVHLCPLLGEARLEVGCRVASCGLPGLCSGLLVLLRLLVLCPVRVALSGLGMCLLLRCPLGLLLAPVLARLPAHVAMLVSPFGWLSLLLWVASAASAIGVAVV